MSASGSRCPADRITGFEGRELTGDGRFVYAATFNALSNLWALGLVGDVRAQKVYDLVRYGFVHVYRRCGKPEPVMCLLCDRAFIPSYPPAAIAVVFWRADDPETEMCSGICDACYDDVGVDELMDRVVAYYRDRAKDDACIAKRIDFPGRLYVLPAIAQQRPELRPTVGRVRGAGGRGRRTTLVVRLIVARPS